MSRRHYGGHWRNSLSPTIRSIETIVKNYETFVTGLKGKEQDKNPDLRYDPDLKPVLDRFEMEDTPKKKIYDLEQVLEEYLELGLSEDSPGVVLVRKQIEKMGYQYKRQIEMTKDRHRDLRTGDYSDEEIYKRYLLDRRSDRKNTGYHDCPEEILEHRRKLIEVRNEIVSYMEREEKKLGNKTSKPVNLTHPTPYHGNGKVGGK